MEIIQGEPNAVISSNCNLHMNLYCKICSSFLTFFFFYLREPSWNLSEYIKTLRTELKSWRRVYWRLWGDCHFQFCSLCHSHYPIYQRNWCLHHADPPQFFSMENQRTLSYPIGRYPCCGERVYRFEVVKSSTVCETEKRSKYSDFKRRH